MRGVRVGDVPDPSVTHATLRPGEYRRTTIAGAWTWEACTPNGLRGDLRNHEVVEHEDGTITVSPSILVERAPSESWHGYLERGVWREC